MRPVKRRALELRESKLRAIKLRLFEICTPKPREVEARLRGPCTAEVGAIKDRPGKLNISNIGLNLNPRRSGRGPGGTRSAPIS